MCGTVCLPFFWVWHFCDSLNLTKAQRPAIVTTRAARTSYRLQINKCRYDVGLPDSTGTRKARTGSCNFTTSVQISDREDCGFSNLCKFCILDDYCRTRKLSDSPKFGGGATYTLSCHDATATPTISITILNGLWEPKSPTFPPPPANFSQFKHC